MAGIVFFSCRFVDGKSEAEGKSEAKVRREENEEKRGHFEENFEDFRFQS